MKNLKITILIACLGLFTTGIKAQSFTIEPVKEEAFYVTHLDALPSGTNLTYEVMINADPSSNYGAGNPTGLTLQNQSYNGANQGKWHIISRKNYIIIETVRKAGTADYEYMAHLTVARKDISSGTPTSEIVKIPISYSNKALTTENDESVYVLPLVGNDAFSEIVLSDIYFTDETTTTPTVLTAPDVAKNIRVTLVVEEERYEITETPWNPMDAMAATSTGNSSFINLNWENSQKRFPKPSYFELEWTFKDAEDDQYSTFPTSIGSTVDPKIIALFKDNCSKVVTPHKTYDVLNSFPREGRLFFRYRRVRPRFEIVGNRANFNPYFKEYSTWVYATLEVKDGTALIQMPEKNKNWTLESSYAEGDLRKDVINYFDGSGRSRLTLTNMAQEKDYIFSAQSLLDYEGNPVVQFLPTPIEKPSSGHVFKYQTLNKFPTPSGSTNPKDNYDKIGSTPGAITTTNSAASKYYSGNSFLLPTDPLKPEEYKNNFIPKANDYPYSYTELSGYGSGKPVRQTSPGLEYVIPATLQDPDHTTRYNYVEPLQVELDILFGNNVGPANFYKKTVITDPNNQSTVAYTDGHGRTIATALLSIGSGNSLEDIDTKPHPMKLTQELVNSKNKNVNDDGVIYLSKKIMVDKDGTEVELIYDVDENELIECPGFCYNCAYKIEITLTYPDKSVVTLLNTTFDEFTTQEGCNKTNPAPNGKSFTADFDGGTGSYQTLKKGEYVLVKKLTPLVERDAAMEQVLDNYLTFAASNPADNCKIRSLYSFQEEEINGTDFQQCESLYKLDKCSSFEENIKSEMTPKKGIYTKEFTAAEITANGGVEPHFSIFNQAGITIDQKMFDDFSTNPNNEVITLNNVIVGGTPVASYAPPYTSTVYNDPNTAMYASGYKPLSGIVSTASNTSMLVVDYRTGTGARTIELAEYQGIPVPTGTVNYFIELRVMPMKYGANVNESFKLQIDIDGNVNYVDLDLNQFCTQNSRSQWTTIKYNINNALPVTRPSSFDIKIKEYQESPSGDYGVLLIDEIEIYDLGTNCGCEAWIDQNGQNYTTQGIREVLYPYSCLKGAFDKSGITTKSGKNPATLNPTEFIDQFDETWLDDMIKLHPFYCKLGLCEIVNSPESRKFESDLQYATTYAQAQYLINATTPPALNTHDVIFNADPAFANLSSNPKLDWLVDPLNNNSMIAAMKKYYDFVEGSTTHQLEITELAMAITLAEVLTDFSTIKYDKTTKDIVTQYLNALSTPTSGLGKVLVESGFADVYWARLKSLYLSKRDFMTNGIYSGGTCHQCNTWGLADLSDFSDPNQANHTFGRHNIFPGYDGKTKTAKQLVDDYLNNSDAPNDVKNATKTTAGVNNMGTSLQSYTNTQKSTDCSNYMTDQLKKHYPLNTAGTDVLKASSCSTTTVSISTLAAAIDEVCDGTAIYNATNGNDPYEYIEKKFNSYGLFCCTTCNSVTDYRMIFERSPYLIDVTHALYDENKLLMDVDATDLEKTPDPGLIPNPLSGDGLQTDISGLSTVTDWDDLLDLIDDNSTSMKFVEDQSGNPVVYSQGATKIASDFKSGIYTGFDFSKLSLGSVSIAPDPEMHEFLIMDEDISTAGHFFYFSFTYDNVSYSYRYLCKDQIYKLKDNKILFRKNPKHEQRITPNELKTLVTDFIEDVVKVELFISITNSATPAANELPYAIWNYNWPRMFTNYANFKTGLEISFNDYKNMMVSSHVLDYLAGKIAIPGTSNFISGQQLEDAFEFYASDPIVCSYPADDNTEFCNDCVDYYTAFKEYVDDNYTTPRTDYMKASDIEAYFNSFDFTQASLFSANSTPYATWNTTNFKIEYAMEEYLGESNDLYIINTTADHIDNLDALESTFQKVLLDGGMADLYTDNDFTQKTVLMKGSYLYPDPFLTSGTGCNFSYNQLNKGYFEWKDAACHYDTDLGLDYGSNLQHPGWINKNADGTLWIHFNVASSETYKDIYLNYEMYNWDYSITDIVSIEGIEPIYRQYGTTYEFNLIIKLDGGRIVKIPGESDYPLADICVIPEAVLWNPPNEMRKLGEYNCERLLYEKAFQTAEERYNAQLGDIKNEYYQKIVNRCNQAQNESLEWSYQSDMYHYTLFYYDQAGNLVQTVPPEGVNPFMDDKDAQNNPINPRTMKMVELNAVDNFRTLGTGSFTAPNHDMLTLYKYNTLNNVVEKVTPDEGTTRYYYNELGQLVLSQNDEQALNVKYSYTLYDELSRIEEVGEVPTSVLGAFNANEHIISSADWDNLEAEIRKKDRTYVVHTFYDKAFIESTDPKLDGYKDHIEGNQFNLRNRVSAMCFYESFVGTDNEPNPVYNDFQNAIFYSYDISGNVNTLWRNLIETGLDVVKRVDYDYDLVSGNVMYVHYQTGEADELHHNYTYDDDNRIEEVFISRNGLTWEHDATYEYYLHGPLARTILGKNNVQGVDYIYNLQGWLKNVNGINYDVGKDGTTTAKDVLSYVLHYHQNDYAPVSIPGGVNVDQPVTLPVADKIKNLYNGNIAEMDVKYFYDQSASSQPKLYQKTYTYDQLNRIKKYEEPKSDFKSGLSASQKRFAEFKYDGNGNLDELKRNIDNSELGKVNMSPLNDFEYNYTSGTNKLEYVTDDEPSWSRNGGTPPSTATQNYNYDNIGNLIMDHHERVSIDWNPIGKVKKVSSRDMISLHLDDFRRPFDQENEYDPMGERIKKKITNYNATKGYGMVMLVAFNDPNTDPVVITIPEEEARTSDFENNFETWLKDYITGIYGSTMGDDIDHLNSLFLAEPSAYHFSKKDQNTEYYIRDAQGNILAIYQKKIGVERSEDNFALLLENAKDYFNYTDAKIKTDLVEKDLALYGSFLDWTLPLFGPEENLNIDLQLIVDNHNEIMLRLVNNYNQEYSDYYYDNHKDDFKQLLKGTEDFDQFLFPFIVNEVEVEYGNTLTQQEKDDIALQRYEAVVNDPLPPADKYFKEDNGNGAFWPHVFDGIQQEHVYTNTLFKSQFKARLLSDPVYEEEFWIVSTRGELFRLQYALTPVAYLAELEGVSQHQGNTVNMIAEWMAVSEGYKISDFMNRIKDMNGGTDHTSQMLGLEGDPANIGPNGEPAVIDVPHIFENPFVIELAEHHLYGSSRLGIMKKEAFTVDGNVGQHLAGHTQFQLTDHLGNVRNTVTDRVVHDNSVPYADVTEVNDYYPFGMKMDSRSKSANVDMRHYENFQAGQMIPIYDNSGSELTLDLATSNTANGHWCHYLYVDPASTITRPRPVTSKPYVYYYYYYFDQPAYCEYDATGAYIEQKIPGNKGITGWSLHKHEMVYSPTCTSHTYLLTFEVMAKYAFLDKVTVANDHGTGNEYHTDFTDIPSGINDQTWTTVTCTVKVDNGDYFFGLRGIHDPANATQDGWIRIKNVKSKVMEVDQYKAAPLTKAENRAYRFGFNDMHREEDYNAGGYKDVVVFEDDFTTDLSQWTIGINGLSQPLATHDLSNGEMDLDFQGSCGVITSNEFAVEDGKLYYWTIETMAETGGTGANDPSIYMDIEYYNPSNQTWETYDPNFTDMDYAPSGGSFPKSWKPNFNGKYEKARIKLWFVAPINQTQVTTDITSIKITTKEYKPGRYNNYDFGERIYDPRIVRWASVDGHDYKYPDVSPYSFSNNSPLIFLDPDGNDIVIYLLNKNQERYPAIRLVSDVIVENFCIAVCLDDYQKFVPGLEKIVKENGEIDQLKFVIPKEVESFFIDDNDGYFDKGAGYSGNKTTAFIIDLGVGLVPFTGAKRGVELVFPMQQPNQLDLFIFTYKSDPFDNLGFEAGGGVEFGFGSYDDGGNKDRSFVEGYSGYSFQISGGYGVMGGTLTLPTGQNSPYKGNPFHASYGWTSLTFGAAIPIPGLGAIKAGGSGGKYETSPLELKNPLGCEVEKVPVIPPPGN